MFDRAMLGKRIVTGAILVSAVSAVLALGSFSCYGKLLMLVLTLLMSIIASGELASMTGTRGVRRAAFMILPVVPAFCISLWYVRIGICDPEPLFVHTASVFSSALTLVALFLMYSGVIAGLEERSGSREYFSRLFPAQFSLALGCGSLCALAGSDAGPERLAWLIASTALNDIGAYFAGNIIHGPAMAPAISPSKTWSGSIGGLVLAVVFGIAARYLLQPGLGIPQAAIIAVIIGLAAQAGDLLESYTKREFGTKDSGSLMGSHGGLLDRIDSHLGAAAALFAILYYLQ